MAAMILAAPALAQSHAASPPVAPPAAPTVDGAAPPAPDIVVTGRSRRASEDFVRSVVEPSGGTGQLARWNDPVCVRVLNLKEPQAGQIKSRIEEVARTMTIRVAKPGCKANITIAMTNDPDGVVKLYLNAAPGLIAQQMQDLPASVRQFTKAWPVRWINFSETRYSDGMPVTKAQAGSDVSNFTFTRPSRIVLNTREHSVSSFVIVDMRAMQSISWGQLADYLCMVTLARPRLGFAYKGSTIMALFAARDAGIALPPGLTDQDVSTLTALYRSNDLQSGEEQRAEIVARSRKAAAGATDR